jgi:hypothetical protein
MGKIYITINQLIISIVLFGGNTFLLFFYYLPELFSNFDLLNYLTHLSYYANSIYLLLCLVCDIFLYLDNKDENEMSYRLMEEEEDNNSSKDNNIKWFEQLNNWNRNKYGVVCNTFSFFVSISFWILFLLGESYIRVSNTFYAMLSTINLHLIISILIIIDILCSKREHKFSNEYFGIISLIFLIYCAYTGINKYYFNSNTYAFMNGSFLFLIFYVVISFCILYVSYLLNVYLINYKIKEVI